MAFGSLRKFDVQAKYGLVLSLISVVPMIAMAVMLFRNYDPEPQRIVYGAGSLWMPAFLGMVGLAFLLSGVGLLLGLNSAGQRRNAKTSWSWAAFFIGGVVVSFCVVGFLAFFMLRLALTAG